MWARAAVAWLLICCALPAGAQTPAASADAASSSKPECTPGARFFVLHEEGWSAVTVREKAPSGDRCIARIDGGTPDDEVVFALDKTLPWSIDGPGKPVTSCDNGAKVLAEEDGAWYPAKITGKANAEGLCPIKYDTSDGDEDNLPLKRLRRLE